MKKISYLCSTCLITCSALAHADISFFHDNLLAHTESTLAVESPFLSSSQIKLAAVYPLGDNSSNISFRVPKATSCASGYENYSGKCVKKCDRSVYPFTTQPNSVKGSFDSCSGISTYYGYTSCNNGWTLSNHDCIENTCDGYVPQASLTHCQTAGGDVCYRGNTTVYKCSTCDTGWVLNASGVCVEKSCPSNEYPYPSDPGEDAGTIKSCQSGALTWYGYESCNTGWVKSGSYCNKVQCDTTTYPYTTQGQATGCTSAQECKSGSDSYYGCGTSGCKSGYVANGNQCDINQCTGYYPSSEITNCKTRGDTCDKGSTTVYKCTECNSGYSLNTIGKCDANQCEGYTSNTANITGCSVTLPCQKGSSIVYKCTSCSTGYQDDNNGGCTAISCPTGQINIYAYWCNHDWVDIPVISE